MSVIPASGGDVSTGIGFKECTGCRESKPWSDFSPRSDRGGIPTARCRTCRAFDAQVSRRWPVAIATPED